MSRETEERRTERSLEYVYPDLREKFYLIAADMLKSTGKKLIVTEGYRSVEVQRARYRQGRTAPGKIITFSQPGSSIHNFGLAFDVCFSGDDPYLDRDPKVIKLWERFGGLVEAIGLRWGGRFPSPDRPHVQKLYGLTPSRIQGLYQINGVGSVWSEIDRLQNIPAPEWEIGSLPPKEDRGDLSWV